MSALTWDTLQSVLLSALSQAPSPYIVIPPDFAELYPRATSYAESRITQEIPLLANRVQTSTTTVTANSRKFDLSTLPMTVTVVERIALITPGADLIPSAGVRNQYIKTTLDYIDMFWPQESQTLAPNLAQNIGRYWAYGTHESFGSTYVNNDIVIAPTPDLAYTIEVTGLAVPTPISSGNQQTYLSTIYPDLLTAACMVFLEGALMRNYGAQADEPRAAQSWESQYQTLKASCEFEEKRRRGMVPDAPMMAAAH